MYICYTVYATRSARICTEKLFLWVGEGALFFFLYRNWKKKRCDTQSKLPNIKYIQDIAHAYFDAQNVTEILV